MVFKGITLELYESTIPPLLRYFHIHNVSPSGWIFIHTTRAQTPEIKTTTCTYEFICNLSHIKPLPNKETIVPYKICSFDIEASSSHGDFPLPIKTYKRLAINIVDMFMRMEASSQKLDYSRSKSLLKRCILTAFSFDKFENIDVVYPKNIPSKTTVISLIDILQNTPIKAVKENNCDADNSHLLNLEAMFDQIKQQMGSNGETTGDGDGEAPVEVESAPIWTKSRTYVKKLGKAEEKQTLVDILLSSKYERDAKIQYTNEVFTNMFPRLEGDQVTFIGSTFLRYGDPEPYLNHCLVLGSCDPVEGQSLNPTKNESELLLKWQELIQSENPDVIIGYNIFGFDYEFMFRRAQENHCEHDFLKLSRKCDEVCATESEGQLSIENNKIVLATGEYDLRFYKTTGRLQIDMYTYFRRDFNLASYKLDDVAGQYISDHVKRIEHTEHPTHGAVTELFSKI